MSRPTEWNTQYDTQYDSFAREQLPPPELWPELRFDLPQLHYPERMNCVAQLVDAAVARGGGARIAIVGEHETWTYAQLQEKIDRIAHVLRGTLALAPGNRVLLRGANNPMMAACILAVLKAGCIAVPTMPLLRARELATIAGKAKVNAVLCAASLRAEIDAMPSGRPDQVLYFGADDIEPQSPESLESLMVRQPSHFDAADTAADDICLISFTSGTTGVPKGTMHFHRDVMAICDCFPRSILDSQPSDIFIGTPPLAFTFGLGGLLLFPLRVGATAVLLEKLTPESLLQAIETHHATICFTAPTFYRQMAPLADKYDLDRLKKTVSAGEALPLATRESWQGHRPGDDRRHRRDRDAAYLHLRRRRPDTSRRHRQATARLPGLHPRSGWAS